MPNQIIHEATTGNLLFDPDGEGGVATTRFAVITAGLLLTSADYRLIQVFMFP